MSHQSAGSSDSSRSINLNSQVLRGLAILSIILHNYTHWMHGAIFENEFALVSVALIFVTSLSFLPWITTPIFACALGISCTQLLPQSVNKPLAWVGGISAAIFVSHPIVRQLGLALAEKLHFSPYQSVVTFLISALLLGALFQPILNRSSKLFMKLAKH